MDKLALVSISNEIGSPLGKEKTLGDLISLIVTSSITVAGIAVLFLFIYGGFKIITGAGSSDPRSAGQGKQAVTYAVIGFIIVFTAYWVIRLTETLLGDRFITLANHLK